MANPVPYDPAPTVSPTGAPGNDYERIQSSPEDFGFLVGQAQERTGRDITGAGVAGIDIATQRQTLYNRVAADDAYNSYQKQLNALLYGDPNDATQAGYYGTKGADAMSKRKSIADQIDNLRNNVRMGLHTDMARLLFDEDSRRLQMFTMDAIGRHYNQQFDNWQTGVHKAQTDNAVESVRYDPNNDVTYNNNLHQAIDGEVKHAQDLYGHNLTDAQYNDAVRAATNRMAKERVEALSVDQPLSAQAFLRAHKTDFAQGDYDTLSRSIISRVADVGAQKIMSGGGDWYERAIDVENPGRNPRATSPTGARGNGQIIDSTWKQFGCTGDPYDAGDNKACMVKIHDGYERSMREGLGREPTDAEVYLAYNLGPTAAQALLNNPNAIAGTLVDPHHLIVNKLDPHMTAGTIAHQVMARFDNSGMGGGGPPKDEAEAIDRASKWAKSVSDDPALEQSTISAVRRNYATIHQAGAAERGEYERTIPNLIRAAEDGVQGVTLGDEDKIRQVMGPKGETWINEFHIAQRGGQIIRDLAGRPTSDWIAAMNDLDSGQGVLSTMLKSTTKGTTGPGVGGAEPDLQPDQLTYPRLRASISALLARKYSERLQAFEEDPAQYALTNSPVARNALKPSSPGANANPLEHYAGTTLAIQRQLGVPEDQQRVLTRAQAQQFAMTLQKTPDAKGYLDSLEKQFGSAWNHAFQDMVTMGKISPDYQAVQALEDPQAGALLARALNDEKPQKDGKPNRNWGEDLVDPHGKLITKDIENQVKASNEIQNLKYSLVGSGFSKEQADGVVNSAVTLAYADAYYNRHSAAEASQYAIQAFTAHYHFPAIGAARIPDKVFPQVAANMRAALDGPAPDIAIPEDERTGRSFTKDSYWSYVSATPHWITNPRENGLWLKDNQNRTVMLRNGQPYEISFDKPPPIFKAQPTTATGAVLPTGAM